MPGEGPTTGAGPAPVESGISPTRLVFGIVRNQGLSHGGKWVGDLVLWILDPRFSP